MIWFLRMAAQEPIFSLTMVDIQFLDTPSPTGLKKLALKNFMKQLVLQENKKFGDVSLVFCTDDYLLEINRQYLNHDYFTDIITFDYSENEKVSGDLMISLDRLRENAASNKVTLIHELHRVVFHGLLHLCGYKDKKPADKKLMTEKENFYLSQFIPNIDGFYAK